MWLVECFMSWLTVSMGIRECFYVFPDPAVWLGRGFPSGNITLHLHLSVEIGTLLMGTGPMACQKYDLP